MERKSESKDKKKISLKVRDMTPKKDAKGGRMVVGDPCEGGELRKK